MAQFQIDDASSVTSVVIDLQHNVLSDNTWSIVSGDSSVLNDASKGTWIFSSLENNLTLFDDLRQRAAHFEQIDMSIGLDPFSNLKSGDSGSGITNFGTFLTWTFK